jgi:hypothetical protein
MVYQPHFWGVPSSPKAANRPTKSVVISHTAALYETNEDGNGLLLLIVVLRTGQDHDQVGNDSHDDVGTRHASQETEVEDQERSGDAPVDVAGPEDLAVGGGESVGNVVVLLTLDDLVQ